MHPADMHAAATCTPTAGSEKSVMGMASESRLPKDVTRLKSESHSKRMFWGYSHLAQCSVHATALSQNAG
jgi:hypothetical protein